MSELPNQMAQTEDFEFAALDEAKNYREVLLQRPAITRMVSVEPDAKFCDRFRAAFPRHEIVEGTVDDLKVAVAWNPILSVNVLEHIQQDERELAIYRKMLAPAKGSLCLFVPARPEIYAPLDKDFGHFRRYTKAELRRKLEAAGFEIVKLRYYNWVGYFAWWLSFCVLKKRRFDLASVRLFDRVIFPLVHGWERHVCVPPFGQSLLAVARAK